MQIPLKVTYRNIRKTESIEKLVRDKVAKLEKVCGYMVSCRVAVEMPQRHQQTGNPFRVRIDMRVPPGHELVIKRESAQGNVRGSLPQTLREAFSAATRQLKELVKKQRAEIKTHPSDENIAFVVKLFRKEGYGFIKSGDGREFYFHKNSVLHNDFDRIEIGTGVRFEEKAGMEGPQASSVQIIDKPGARIPASGKSAAELPLGWGK